MHYLLIYFSLFFFCTAGYSQDPLSGSIFQRKIPAFILNAGTYTEFYNHIQINTTGGVRKFDPAPTLGLGLMMPMTNHFLFLPEINWVLPQKSGERIIKNIFMMRADFAYRPIDWLQLRLGTSIFWLNQQGTGGTEKINNGNTTATFYYPEENRSSYNNTFDLGTEVLYKKFALRFQTYFFSILRAERRQVSYSLFLSYYWDR
jgi:hypothetical protein